MSISREEIHNIAQLAHLGFESAELERFAAEFARGILGYLESLERLNLEGVEPTSHITGAGQTAYRPDQERAGLPVEEALRESPENGEGHFLVPRFIG